MEGGTHNRGSQNGNLRVQPPNIQNQADDSAVTKFFGWVSKKTKGLLQGVGLRNGDTDNGILKMIKVTWSGCKSLYNRYSSTSWPLFKLLNIVICMGLPISLSIRIVGYNGPLTIVKLIEAGILMILILATQGLRLFMTQVELAEIRKVMQMQLVSSAFTLAIMYAVFSGSAN